MISKKVRLELIEHPKPGFVFWLKLPSYQIAWMYSEFGFPCCIPTTNELHWEMQRGLVNNPTDNNISTVCMSARMWDATSDTIDPDTRSLWMPIAIPERVYQRGTLLRPTASWQLRKPSAVNFRREVHRQFWASWSMYYQDRLFHAAANKQHVTMDECYMDWMMAHGIDMDDYDIIKRQRRRDLQYASKAARERIEYTNFNIRENVNDIFQSLRERKKSGRSRYLHLLQIMKKQQK